MRKHILNIVSEEVRYIQAVYIAIAVPLIIFTLMGIADIKVIMNLSFVDRYFWSITIGIGAYMLIYGMNMNRVKEQRDRAITLLPVSLKARTVSKLIAGILPVLLIWCYLEILKHTMRNDWVVFVERVNAQLGLFFILLGTISILYEFTKMKLNMNSMIYGLSVIAIFISIALTTAGLLYLVTYAYLINLPIGGDELYFYTWGLILTIISMGIFYRRESYVS